jgi:hypothetical protein
MANITDAAIEARRAYNRAWRAAHPEKVKEYRKRNMQTYWEKKAREAAEATAAALAEDQTGTELTEDQSGSSSGSDPEGQAATNGGELTDDQLREMVTRKREQVKGV